MRFVFLVSFISLFLFGCSSKIDKAMALFKKGKVFEATQILEREFKKTLDPEVEKALNLVKASEKFEKVETQLKKGNLKSAWKIFNTAAAFDKKSDLYKSTLEKIKNATLHFFSQKNLDSEDWPNVIKRADYLLKLNIGKIEAHKAKAVAHFEMDGSYTYRVVKEWQAVKKLNGDDSDAEKALKELKGIRSGFEKAFNRHQTTILKMEYANWLKGLDKDCRKTMENNIKSNIKHGDQEHRNLRDYFNSDVIADAKNDNIIPVIKIFEDLGKGKAIIHYAYPSWKAMNQVLAKKRGRQITFGCERGSDLNTF